MPHNNKYMLSEGGMAARQPRVSRPARPAKPDVKALGKTLGPAQRLRAKTQAFGGRRVLGKA